MGGQDSGIGGEMADCKGLGVCVGCYGEFLFLPFFREAIWCALLAPAIYCPLYHAAIKSGPFPMRWSVQVWGPLRPCKPCYRKDPRFSIKHAPNARKGAM